MKSKDYLSEKIRWKESSNPEFPLQTYHDGDELRLRLNNFPAESLYTLFVNDREIMDLEDLPEKWTIKRTVKHFVSVSSAD